MNRQTRSGKDLPLPSASRRYAHGAHVAAVNPSPAITPASSCASSQQNIPMPVEPAPEPCSDLMGPSLLDSYASDTLDRAVHANLARLTFGISPSVVAMAYLDWLVHLGMSPGKQARLLEKGLRKAARLALYAAHSLKIRGDG